jgi:uncharacterized protein YifN (PemK superfamily)
MTPAQATYRRLPGARRRLLRKATLWLSTDHILAVDSRRFTEAYKRYYFKDIQAIIVTQISTATSRTIDLVVLIILVVLGLIAWRLESRGAFVITGLILLGYLIHKLLGPMCSCHLITAVSSDKLPSLTRVRTAAKAVRMIHPLVEQAQRSDAT